MLKYQLLQTLLSILVIGSSFSSCRHIKKNNETNKLTETKTEQPTKAIFDISLNLTLSESGSQKKINYVRIIDATEQANNQSLLDQFRIDSYIIDEMDWNHFSAVLLFPDLKIIDIRTRQPVLSECFYVIYDLVSGFLFSFSSPDAGFQYFSEENLPINSPFSGTLCTSDQGEMLEFRSEGKLAIPYESLWFFEHQFMLSRGFQKKESASSLNLSPPDKEDIASMAAILIGAGLGHIVAVKHLDDLLLDKLLPGRKAVTPEIPSRTTIGPSPSDALKKHHTDPLPTTFKSPTQNHPLVPMDSMHRGGNPFSAVNGGHLDGQSASKVPYFFRNQGLDIDSPHPSVPKTLNGHSVYRAHPTALDFEPPVQGLSGYRVESNPISGMSRLFEVRQKNPITPKEHVAVYKSLAEDKLNEFHIVTNKSGRALISQGMEGTCNPSSCLNALSSVDPNLSVSEINRAFRELTQFDYRKLGTIETVEMRKGKQFKISHILTPGQEGYSNGRYLAEAFNTRVRHTNPRLKRFTMEFEKIPPYRSHSISGRNRWYANALLKQFEESGGKPMIISTKVQKNGRWSGHAVTLENIQEINGEVWVKGINSWGIEFTVKVSDQMVFPGYQKVIDLGPNGTETITAKSVPFRLEDHFVKILF